MKPLQDSSGMIILGLAMVVLLDGCGSPPLIQPKNDVPVAQTTAATSQSVSTATVENEATTSPESVTESAAPESPLATPMSVPAGDTPTAVLETPASSSNEIQYSAEKISLAPVNLRLDLPEISASSEDAPQISFGGWSNSGQQFAFVLLFPDGAAELWIANIDGTDLQKIVADHSGGFMIWSPDDSRILYYKFKGIGHSKDELWTIQLDTNTSMNLNEPPGVSIDETDVYGNVAWVDEHHLLYPTYPKSETGSRHLWLHNVQTGQIEEVEVDKALSTQKWGRLKLAPDKKSIGGRVEDTPWYTYWVGKLVEENGQWRLDAIETLISNDVISFSWTPDSSKLVVVSLEVGNDDTLQIIDLASGEIQEIQFPATVGTVAWSPDSGVMIINLFPGGSEVPMPIYTANIDGSGLHQLDARFFSHMEWSPDGRHLGLFNLLPLDDADLSNPLGVFKVEGRQ